jgi:signal transduction histidine kinase
VSWLLVAGLVVVVVRLRRRLELVARAEHELRGPLTAFALGLESMRRGREVALDAELDRARVALDDLTAARRGRRAATMPKLLDLERVVRSSADAWGVGVEWRAGVAPVVADAGRVAQALGNLFSNAVEHGDGPATVVAERADHSVRVKVVNPTGDRGRGLRIASSAARDAGGVLSLDGGPGEFRATLDLPLAG